MEPRPFSRGEHVSNDRSIVEVVAPQWSHDLSVVERAGAKYTTCLLSMPQWSHDLSVVESSISSRVQMRLSQPQWSHDLSVVESRSKWRPC